MSQHADDRLDHRGRRSVNGRICLRVPRSVIGQKCALYMHQGKPTHRTELLNDSDYSIISKYQSEYRGIVQYYMLAQNVSLFYKLRWVAETSLLKTLACKHKSSVVAMAHQYKSTIETPTGLLKCLEVSVQRENNKPPLVARFGGIPLRRKQDAVLIDRHPQFFKSDRNELLKRMLADTCELCGSNEKVEVHHIRKLANLKRPGRAEKPKWMKIMAARRRKTLVVCRKCHEDIHAGRSTASFRK